MNQLVFNNCPLSPNLSHCCLCGAEPRLVIVYALEKSGLTYAHARCENHEHLDVGTNVRQLRLSVNEFHSLNPDELTELMNRPKELEAEEVGF